MKKALLTMAVCGASLAWCADNGGIGGPVSGYVVEGRGRAIRPINGIPGAARLGDPVSAPFAIGAAAIAPAQDYAIATPANGDGRPVLLRGLRSGSPAAAAIDNAIAAQGIEIAESGGAAAIYSDSQLQFLGGLPEAPVADAPIDAAAANGVLSVAVDAAGRAALLIARDGSIFHATRGGELKQVARVPGAVSASFLPASDDAVVASAETGDVILLHGLSGSLTIRTAAGAANGLSSARSVRGLNTGEAAVVDGQGRLGIVTLETGSIEWIGLAGAAERIDSLGGGLLALNTPGAGPLLLLDTRQGRAAYFVPPAARANQLGEIHHRK